MNNKTQDSYAHFTNRSCRFFPCHKTDDPDSFNCLFCYCPLYTLGENCGGSFKYTAKGVKVCSDCLLPHSEGGYEYVTGSFPRIVASMQINKIDNLREELDEGNQENNIDNHPNPMDTNT